LYRVTVEGGSLFYNHKPRTLLRRIVHPVEWLTKTEWSLAQEITWDRGSTPALRPDRFYPTTEKVYWLFKGDRPRLFNAAYAIHKEVWRVNADQDNPHPAPFPLEIPLRCVGACSAPGDVVLDPFTGSGQTGVACAQLGRNFIGIERETKWHEYAQRRIAAAQAQLVMPLFEQEAR
jgi:site-specific DNA-methyltransferase (adenine-specific)